MLFHSQVFLLLFLPLVLAGYYLSARSTRLREWGIIAASAVFYGWWDVRFLPLLVGQVTISWLIAKLYFSSRRRWLLAAGVLAGLPSVPVVRWRTASPG